MGCLEVIGSLNGRVEKNVEVLDLRLEEGYLLLESLVLEFD